MALVLFSLVSSRAETTNDSVSGKTGTPGASVATAISTITGVAISPLMGAGAIGAWRYYHAASQAERDRLPWFAQTWFWLPALLLTSVCALKDIFGIAVPTTLKKPFDLMETLEHKVSGLVIAGAFVPLVASVFKDAGTPVPGCLTVSSGTHFIAAIDPARLYNSISIPIALVAFFVVWLASYAISILILLSPFGFIDAALKSLRLFFFVTVFGSAWLNPWLGAVWALMIIFFASLIAGWSFRLSHFGLVFVWDFLTMTRLRFKPADNGNYMYLGSKTGKVPVRTYGKLILNAQGALVFHYRPWLVLPARQFNLTGAKYAVGKGLFYSEILCLDGDRKRMAMLLPPRYRTHEQALAGIYGLAGVRDTGLLAAWAWLKDFVDFRLKQLAA
jgi:hypothetical protein